MVREKNTTWRK